MANTSATGGYLVPTSTAPSDDVALEDVFQAAIAGITGIDGTLVRPRFQPGNPNVPDQTIDWCAFSAIVQTPDDNPSLQHNPADDGSTTLKRHVDIEVFCSFYGTGAAKNAGLLRDGLYIVQNLEQLELSGIAFVDAGEIRLAPEMVNQKWIRRNDLRLKFRRQVVRDYAILNIEAAEAILIDDTGHVNETIVISQP